MARKKKAHVLAPPTAADGSYSDTSDADESVSRSVDGGINGIVDKLCAEIEHQREVISQLTTRLNYVWIWKKIPAVFDRQNKQNSVGCDDMDKNVCETYTLRICSF